LRVYGWKRCHHRRLNRLRHDSTTRPSCAAGRGSGRSPGTFSDSAPGGFAGRSRWPATWKVVAVEPITSGDALAAAHAQRAARAKAKWSLHTVAVNTLKAHQGFSLVSIVPSLKAIGHPVADVTLVKGDEWKTVSVMLTY
jgi:hypothetical protein